MTKTKLPFIFLRVPNTAFGISMGLAGNSIMWGTASNCPFVQDVINAELPMWIFFVASAAIGGCVFVAYVYKAVTRFEYVKDEWEDAVRIHFMSGPNLTMMMLALAVPPNVAPSGGALRACWTVALCCQVVITQLIYEGWMFGERSHISTARPQFLLSTVGWFILAVLGQKSRVEEVWGIAAPAFCLGAGAMLYGMVVIAVMNGLHANNHLKGDPALTLVIAPPSVAAVALDNFDGDPHHFSVAAEMVLGWCIVWLILILKIGPTITKDPPVVGVYWAYVFPLAALANALLVYANTAKSDAAEGLAAVAIVAATGTVLIVASRMAYYCYRCVIGEAAWGDPLLEARLGCGEPSDSEGTQEGGQVLDRSIVRIVNSE